MLHLCVCSRNAGIHSSCCLRCCQWIVTQHCFCPFVATVYHLCFWMDSTCRRMCLYFLCSVMNQKFLSCSESTPFFKYTPLFTQNIVCDVWSRFCGTRQIIAIWIMSLTVCKSLSAWTVVSKNHLTEKQLAALCQDIYKQIILWDTCWKQLRKETFSSVILIES